MNFIGEKCVACGLTFVESDDVVVCPECGSPHHRDCYKKEGKCANSVMHETGEKWKRVPPPAATEEAPPFVICPVCRFPNRSGEERCMRCGSAMNIPDRNPLQRESADNAASDTLSDSESGDNVSRQYLGFDPNEDLGGATLREVSQFVGPNTIYYIPIFKRMKELGSKISFNISCFIFPAFYFANRKMWLWALIATFISVVLSVPTAVMVMAEQNVFTESVSGIIYDNRTMINNIIEICGLFSWIMRIVFCLFGNWMYMRFSLRTLKKLRSVSRNGRISPARAAATGGVQPINILLVTVIMFAASLAALYGIAVALPVLIAFI